MIEGKFTPWGRFKAIRNRKVDSQFLDAVAHETEDQFRIGLASQKSGIHHPGMPRRSSAPGEFPANQSGKLRGSIRSESNTKRATAGSNVFYARFLREGTSKMRRRKMSDDALKAAVPKVRSLLKGWIGWGPA